MILSAQEMREKPIPLVDLKAQYLTIQDEMDAAIHRVLNNTSFIMGSEVTRLEGDFADFCGTKYAIGVASGTAALHLSLLALNIGPGDEVITVSHTFIATAEPIVACGARPVFVDVDPSTFTLDPDKLGAAITPRTKAIIPVHLYGQCADMDAINAIAKQHGIPVLEDAAQAHGATYKSQTAGQMGQLACFSFYPGKNLGAYGDAGAVVTNDESLMKRISSLRNHGRRDKYVHDEIGYGERLDALQAAVLAVKLRHLAKWNTSRRKWASLYTELLQDLEQVTVPTISADGEPVFHLYVIQTNRRDELLAFLKEHNISAGIHYPLPLHMQPAFRYLEYEEGDFPITEKVASQILSLPIYPELTETDVVRVVDTVKAFFEGHPNHSLLEAIPAI
ncbi:MAG: DegT/DnrJ/EryC1/StrS family aminotransferase [Chloroflexota bacterium]